MQWCVCQGGHFCATACCCLHVLDCHAKSAEVPLLQLDDLSDDLNECVTTNLTQHVPVLLSLARLRSVHRYALLFAADVVALWDFYEAVGILEALAYSHCVRACASLFIKY